MEDFRDDFKNELLKIKINNNLPKEEIEAIKKKINSIIGPNIPSSLFRFRTCNTRNFDALLNQKIYAVPTSYMNDPHDGLVFVDRQKLINQIKYALSENFINDTRQYIVDNLELPSCIKQFYPMDKQSELIEYITLLSDENIAEISHKNQKNLEILLADLNLYIDNQIKSLHNISLIASFAQEIDNLAMWAYYADNQKGFALEYCMSDGKFDKCSQCKNLNTELCKGKAVSTKLYPVMYDNVRFDATEWFDYKIGQLILNNMGIDYQAMPDKLFYDKICLFKSIPWKHENEWRMICYPKFDGYSGNPVSVPSVPPIAIYYGIHIKSEDKNVLQNIVKTLNENGCKIKEYQMRISYETNDYNLEAIEV